MRAVGVREDDVAQVGDRPSDRLESGEDAAPVRLEQRVDEDEFLPVVEQEGAGGGSGATVCVS